MNSMQKLDLFSRCEFDKTQLIQIVGGKAQLGAIVEEDAEGF